MITRAADDPLSARSFALWAGVLGPPLAWGIHLVLGDLVFELGCSPGVGGSGILGLSLETWSLIQTIVLGSITVVCGLMALGAWRRLRAISDGPKWDRAHAMALAGMASAAIYLILIAYGFTAPFFLNACGTSL